MWPDPITAATTTIERSRRPLTGASTAAQANTVRLPPAATTTRGTRHNPLRDEVSLEPRPPSRAKPKLPALRRRALPARRRTSATPNARRQSRRPGTSRNGAPSGRGSRPSRAPHSPPDAPSPDGGFSLARAAPLIVAGLFAMALFNRSFRIRRRQRRRLSTSVSPASTPWATNASYFRRTSPHGKPRPPRRAGWPSCPPTRRPATTLPTSPGRRPPSPSPSAARPTTPANSPPRPCSRPFPRGLNNALLLRQQWL